MRDFLFTDEVLVADTESATEGVEAVAETAAESVAEPTTVLENVTNIENIKEGVAE